MPAEQVVDEVVVNGPRPNSANAGRRNASVQTEYIGTGGVPSRVERGGAVVEDDQVREGGRKRTPVRESTQKLIQVVDQGDDAEDAVTETGDPDDKGLVEDVDAKSTDAVVEGGDAAEPEVDASAAEIDRLTEVNRQLLSEMETVKNRPSRGEMTAREKSLDEAERTYLEDPVGAIRHLIGTVLGVAHDSKDVDVELSGLYTDLTSRELNVPLEAAHKATREAIRARQMLARDKRERKAESEVAASRTTQDEESRQTNEAGNYIGNRLSVKSAEGASIADTHPLLMNFSEELDGMKPAVLIWKVIQRETKTGVLDPTMRDDQMIAAAAKLVENHYQALAERFGRTQPKPTDTAKTEPTTAATASKDKRQGPGARTITNATASVAPATSPTKKAAPKQDEAPPKFKTNKERQDWALRRIPI